MSKNTLRASASPFAHLIPGFRAARAEDETDPKDKDKAKGKKAAKPADAAAEEPGEVDETEEVGDGEGVDGDTPPDVGDVVDPDDSLDEDAAPEEDDSDPKVRKAAKSGRKAERSRWAAVMKHPAASGRVAAACQLLSTTTASAKSVIGTLATLPAAEAPVATGQRSRLDERMASRLGPKVGSDAPAAAAGDFAAQSVALMEQVRPGRRR